MAWTERDQVTVGYWPLRQGGRPEWLAAPQVVSPCNVSHGNDRWPEAATLPWLHDSIGLFAADELALAAVPSTERGRLLICGVRPDVVVQVWAERLPDAEPAPRGAATPGP